MDAVVSDFYLPEGIPAPQPAIDGLDLPFWEGAKRGEVLVQRCTKCGNHQATEWICHKCHSFDLEWVKASGKGKIYSWERIWHPVHPALTDAVPYVVVLVEMPDVGNVRLVGNLLGDPRADIVIGSDVEAVFEKHNDFTLIQWKRA